MLVPIRSIKLISAILIASLGMINTLVFGAFSYRSSAAVIQAGYDRNAELIVDRVVDAFATSFRLHERALSVLSTESSLRGELDPFDRKAVTARLASMARLSIGASYFVLALDDGRYCFSDSRFLPPSFDPRNQAWYRGAIDSAAPFYWSEPFFDFSNQAIVISVSTVIREADGRALGVVAVVLPVSRMGSDIGKFEVGGLGLVMLLNDVGRVVASKSDKYIGRILVEGRALAAAGSTRIALTMDGRVYMLRSRQVAPNGMRVAVGIAQREISDASWQIFWNFFWLELAGIAVFCALTYWLVRRGVSPVGDLISLMKRTEEGDYQVKAQFDQYEEIAALSSSFNRMVDAIRTRDQILKKREVRIQNLAYYDNLTGLPNRLQLSETLDKTLALAEGGTGALFYLDLDRFKIINDSMGHAAGDRVLQEIAARLNGNLRPGQMAARIGGDEFIILLPGLDTVELVGKVARRFLDILKKPVELGDKRLDIGGSIGVALYPLHGGDADTLMKNADLAMYSAKRNGRQGFKIYEEHLQKETVLRLCIEKELRDCLAARSLSIVYQPQYHLRKDAIFGFEALLSWEGTELAGLPPGDIVQVAEEAGLIVEIERWVLARSSEFALRASSTAGSEVFVSVNLSSTHIMQSDFVESFLEAIGPEERRSPVHVEITEKTMLGLKGPQSEKLAALAGQGIGICLDGFGTGYSSLNYLQHLPVQALKIDRSCIDEVESDDRKANIAFLMIQLAHGLELRVVAEGVERGRQAQTLKDFGCDVIQGVFVSEPLAEEAALLLLQRPVQLAIE